MRSHAGGRTRQRRRKDRVAAAVPAQRRNGRKAGGDDDTKHVRVPVCTPVPGPGLWPNVVPRGFVGVNHRHVCQVCGNEVLR